MDLGVEVCGMIDAAIDAPSCWNRADAQAMPWPPTEELT